MADKAISCRELDVIGARRTMNIHTTQICDSCKEENRIEGLRLFPTKASQCAIDCAENIRDCKAELVYAYINAEPQQSAYGGYIIAASFFYRVSAVAMMGTGRPAKICGLSVFRKKVSLTGGGGTTKRFISRGMTEAQDKRGQYEGICPAAVLEAAAPVVLDVKLSGLFGTKGDGGGLIGVPPFVCEIFENDLFFGSEGKRVYLTLSQNSTISLERDIQVLSRNKHQKGSTVRIKINT